MLAKINSLTRKAKGEKAETARERSVFAFSPSAFCFFALSLAVLLSGCTPAGPRALLQGKKDLDRGDVADAVAQLRQATTLLATNANAWNYFGVALQQAGQADAAAAAYQNALRLDRDLVEAHFNLGCLALEQNKPDTARTEFTAYTLRRPNEAAGWLKLGSAQLRAGDIVPAERSFSTVLSLKTNEAEAYNGLGLARIERHKPGEAAQFFLAALRARANFAPALLNLAIVNQQYLHDNQAALDCYRRYLALTPRPANYENVKALAAGLEHSAVAATVMAPTVALKTAAPPPEPRTTSVAAPPPEPARRAEPEEKPASRLSHRAAASTAPVPEPSVTPVPTQTVQVQPEPQIVASPTSNPPATQAATARRARAPEAAVKPESIEVPMPEERPKTGFWHRLFGANRTDRPANPPNGEENPTPPPANAGELAGAKPAEGKPAALKPAPVVVFARYHYTSPPKPAPGNRRAAEGAFTKARLAEQDENWPDALQWYRTAADFDPSWFEAQYNTGVIAHRLGNYSVALPRYELALAIRPDAVDARYNFALALTAAGYPVDAANELKKILAANPNDVRAHLALGNLYAQSFHDIPQAREHYLKVLELQPDNPRAADIRFWISANAK